MCMSEPRRLSSIFPSFATVDTDKIAIKNVKALHIELELNHLRHVVSSANTR